MYDSDSIVFVFFACQATSHIIAATMGNTVQKFAFLPPEKDQTISLLAPHTPGSPVQFRRSTSGTDVSFIHFRPEQFASRKSASSTSQPKPLASSTSQVLLWCHGNAEDLGTGYANYVELCKQLGMQVVAFDYSGYGCSTGKHSETQTYDDVRCMLAYLTVDCQVPLKSIVLVGRSLGSGPAVDLASQTPGLGALILLSPLASAISVVANLPRPLRRAGNDIFCNQDKIHLIQSFPVYVIHGMKDTVVPFAHGRLLAERLAAPVEKKGAGNERVETWWIEPCGHNDIEAYAGDRFYANLKRFIRSCAPQVS
jgi:abhydrolase domain-containing protein 17